MHNFILLAEEAAQDAGQSTGLFGDKRWVMWVIIGVVLVAMVVLTIVPQRKRQKQQQNMMNSLAVGTKLMTVGGIVGKIQQVNTDNTLVLNVGTDENPTLIVIDKKAVGYVLEGVAAPAPAPVEEPVLEDAPVEEPVVDEAPAADPFAIDDSAFALDSEDAPADDANND